MILLHVEMLLLTIFVYSIFGIILNEETEHSKKWKYRLEFTFGISFIGLILNSVCMILYTLYNWIFS